MPVGHSVTYEDSDNRMGHHRPLVMRQHPLNVEVRSDSERSTSGTADDVRLMRLTEISISKSVTRQSRHKEEDGSFHELAENEILS